MEAQFAQLEKKFGNPKKVAVELGITDRHYRRIKKDNKVSKTIELLMDRLLSDPGDIPQSQHSVI